MSAIVASLTDDSVEGMLARAGASVADVVEIRLDRIPRVSRDDVDRLAKGLDRPALATLRTTADGGAFGTDPAPRRALLLAAVDAGIPYVDVEATAPFADEVLARAQARGTQVVLSLHLPDTPRSGAIVAYLREARDRGAWCGKLATTATDVGAVARLAEAAFTARREGLPFALMAVDDPWLRRLGPVLGNALVYASDGPPAAPGQVPARELQAAFAALPPVGRGTRGVVLVGHPVAHSRSPALQNAAFAAAGVDAAYVALDVPPEKLPAAAALLRTPGFLGANVTVPHKEAAFALADERAPSAKTVGAANVLVNDGGTLVAHNTDGVGALRALAEAGVDPRGLDALVVGAGGAGKALVHALVEVGAEVTVANRTASRAKTLGEAAGVTWMAMTEAAQLHDAFQAVFNATTVGLDDEAVPFDVGSLDASAVVFDAVYRPGGTALVRAARARGLATIPGEAMLLHQGAAAFELWTGKPAPLEAMRVALARALEAPA